MLLFMAHSPYHEDSLAWRLVVNRYIKVTDSNVCRGVVEVTKVQEMHFRFRLYLR